MVLFGLLQLALLTVAALVVDIGYARASARRNQSIVDLSVLAAGNKLSEGDYIGACVDSDQHAQRKCETDDPHRCERVLHAGRKRRLEDKCSLPGTGLGQARPKVTSARTRSRCTSPCRPARSGTRTTAMASTTASRARRVRLLLTSKEPVFFGGVVGSKGHSVTRCRDAALEDRSPRTGTGTLVVRSLRMHRAVGFGRQSGHRRRDVTDSRAGDHQARLRWQCVLEQPTHDLVDAAPPR